MAGHVSSLKTPCLQVDAISLMCLIMVSSTAEPKFACLENFLSRKLASCWTMVKLGRLPKIKDSRIWSPRYDLLAKKLLTASSSHKVIPSRTYPFTSLQVKTPTIVSYICRSSFGGTRWCCWCFFRTGSSSSPCSLAIQLSPPSRSSQNPAEYCELLRVI